MSCAKHIAFLCLLISLLSGAFSQQTISNLQGLESNLRVQSFTSADSVIRLDSFSVFPQTFSLWYADSGKVQKNLYYFNERLAILQLDPSLVGKSLRASYRVTTLEPLDTIQRYAYNPSFFYTDSLGVVYDPFYRRTLSEPESVFDFGGLNYGGSFSRGFSFGNSQNLSVNSALDLQLSGKFGDDLEILAALSDNNIPIQPDGTTAQIQEFDKVFIRVTKDQHRLIAGDYDIVARDNYFMPFSKQLQGGSFSTGFTFGDSIRLHSSASFAVAKGKFARNEFNGIENNQGPYRLKGAQNETFIIILAGSEKVYANGELLSRGEEFDYIIDYNTGELAFTPNFLATKDIRFIVEFQYAENNYFRSLVHTAHTFEGKKWLAGFSIYAEQDAKNKPIQADIDEETISILESIGNNEGSTYVPSIQEEIYDPEKIQYKLIDSLVNVTLYDSVFVFSTNPDSARYVLTFSYLGPGLGNYIPSQNAANGRVYQWISPVSGIPQGSYEPVVLLATPKKDHYITFQGKYMPDNKTTIKTDIILGNKDPNTFSEIDNDHNKGLGSSLSVDRADKLGKGKDIYVNYGGKYEFTSRYFQPLEPYRPVEFARDWNLQVDTATEHWGQAYIETLKGGWWRNALSFGTFHRAGGYSGYREKIEHYYNKNGWNVRANAAILHARDTVNKSLFFRPDFNVTKWIPWLKGWQLGLQGAMERNIISQLLTDSLRSTSFQNNTIGGSFRTSDSSFLITGIHYRYRTDATADSNKLNKVSYSHTLDWDGTLKQIRKQNISWQFTYRQLQVLDTAKTKQAPENTILGRISYRGSTKKGVFNYNAIYELGSGQEKIKEYVYLEVPPGQGLYKWVDENVDGIRQENEYVISQFSDSASYIKILTDFNKYIPARIVGYSQTFQLVPKAVWYDAKGIKGVLGMFMLQSSIQLRRKSLPGVKVSPFNPFIFASEDSAVISINNSIRQSLLFNSGDPTYSGSYSWIYNQDKILQINGYDFRKRSENLWEARYTPARISTINLIASHGKNEYLSNFFTQNSYAIRFYKVEQGVTLFASTLFRGGISYGFSSRVNSIQYGGENAKQHKLSTNFRFAKVSNLSVDGAFTFAQVKFTGTNGTTKAYQVLEGLQPGQNFIWNLNFDKKLANFLQLSLGYEGRKTGIAKSVHTGKAGIRAIF